MPPGSMAESGKSKSENGKCLPLPAGGSVRGSRSTMFNLLFHHSFLIHVIHALMTAGMAFRTMPERGILMPATLYGASARPAAALMTLFPVRIPAAPAHPAQVGKGTENQKGLENKESNGKVAKPPAQVVPGDIGQDKEQHCGNKQLKGEKRIGFKDVNTEYHHVWVLRRV